MRVLIVGMQGHCSVSLMWRDAGHKVVFDNYEVDYDEIDLIQFTGGSDVSPELYGEISHPRTFSNPDRDRYEKEIYAVGIAKKIPMLGICRGGQFLNVMNGGKMYQDVDRHAMAGFHQALDMLTGRVRQVTSTHHQMMRPAKNAIIVANAYDLSTFKEYMEGDKVARVTHEYADTEALFYPETKCLCFQPHPEYENEDCRKYYFELIDRYITGDK
jgi:gamma-glutamyl-gamma-aminobutyrate hydrolase PuuD